MTNLAKMLFACRRLGIRLTRDVLVVSVSSQTVSWFRSSPARSDAGHGRCNADLRQSSSDSAVSQTSPDLSGLRLSREKVHYQLHRRFRASTSRYGVGQVSRSNRTPLGLHRIARKIGGGFPIGTVFKSRKPIGLTRDGMPEGSIVHRILWLEGLESGFNRGGKVDTFARYIYIHGYGDETSLGKPASHGCVHLAAADLMPLFESIREGTLVWIQ